MMSCLEQDDCMLDLVVIGAGPHALSLLTRLVDDDPDLLSESDRSKTMSAEKFARPKHLVRRHLKKKYDEKGKLSRTLVIDKHGQWMHQWKTEFKALGIQHLRSHEHLHPCPYDFQSLQVWAEMHGREGELKSMEKVNRDECRKAGYHGPFVVPGSQLFLDFCQDLVERYSLAPLVNRGTVDDVTIMDSSGPRKFKIQLVDGRSFTTHRVVCAIGPGAGFEGMRAESPMWANTLPPAAISRLQHSSMLSEWLRKQKHEELSMGGRVLVVGGGQTAAHLALLILQQNSNSSVTLCSRRRITRKQFDVDIAFVGDKRPVVLKRFWNLEDPRKRFEFNAKLRGGGSMSSDVYSSLLAVDSSRLTLSEENEVEQVHWVETDASTSIGEFHVRFDNSDELLHFDFIWLATGGDFDLNLVPLFASLNAQYPITSVNGLPALQSDLSWARNVPVYIMGAFAQLQLGADALNLAGARSGAVVIARALTDDKSFAGSPIYPQE